MFRLQINAKKIFRVSCVIIVGLLLLDLVARWSDSHFKTPATLVFKNLFDLDSEHNIPSVLSFLQLLMASIILAVMATVSWQQKDGRMKAWAGLSLVFAYLSIDELEEVHEQMMYYFRDTFHTTGILYFAWIIPMMAFTVLLAVIYLPFLFKLPARTRNGMMIAGAGFMFSAVGGDMVTGLIVTKFRVLIEHRALTIENVIEEGGEMLSIAYFIYTLLNHMRVHMTDKVTLMLTGKADAIDGLQVSEGSKPNLRVIIQENEMAEGAKQVAQG